MKSGIIEVKVNDAISQNKMSAIFYRLITVVNKTKTIFQHCLSRYNLKTSFLDFCTSKTIKPK